MAGAAVCYSILPLAVYFAEGITAPFWFNSSLRAGLIISTAIFMVATRRPVLSAFTKSLARRPGADVVRQITRPSLMLSCFNAFDYCLLALAVRIVDLSAAAVLFETWPVIFVAFRQWMDRQPIRLIETITFSPAIAGAVLVAASQHADHEAFFKVDATVVLGSMVAIAGSTAIACMAFTFRWADQIHDDLFIHSDNGTESPDQARPTPR